MGKGREAYRAKHGLGSAPGGLISCPRVVALEARLALGLGESRALTAAEFREWGSDPRTLVLLLMEGRPMIQVFARALELRYFDPGTSLNDAYGLVTAEWQGMVWRVVRIPGTCRVLADQVAAEFRLRLADGVPHVSLDSVWWRFPLSGPHVWALEGVKDSPIYQPGGDQDERNLEAFLMEEEEAAFGRRTGRGRIFWCSAPQRANVREGHADWEPATCPECGAECWLMPQVAELRREKPWNDYRAVCSACFARRLEVAA